MPEPSVAADAQQRWLDANTFHHSQFDDVAALARLRKERGLTISVCIPTLNEAPTIGRTISVLRDALVLREPLIEEIAVIDSGSSDETCSIAREAGADVYVAADILPEQGAAVGKGENLWKAIHQLRGDIICYVDADIENIHERFVTGLLGPLLLRDELLFAKAFYDRPLAVKGRVYPTGGGRVTEILVRPLFSLFYPELAAIVQPLSGEYAMRRSLLEALRFPIGYGVETANLIDTYVTHGLGAIAQCDLDVRVHRNRSNVELGRTAFAILQGVLRRIPTQNALARSDVFQHFREGADKLKIAATSQPEIERPPMISLAEYRDRQRTDLEERS
jgi:glucosyl-3-phosphoglycerate synthase